MIVETFGSLDFCWDEYLQVVRRWGGMAGERWYRTRDNLLETGWNSLDDEVKKDLEDRAMNFQGISDAYPNRSTRASVTTNYMAWWLLDIYHQRIMSDSVLREVTLRATESLLEHRICEVCGTKYQRIQLSQYVRDGLLAFDGCCLGCPLHASSESDLPQNMRALIDACGFVPESDMYFEHPAFISRLTSDNFLPTARAYAQLGGVSY